MTPKILLFDLDGTLLRSDKTISTNTKNVLQKCRDKGCLLGISTLRSEQNALKYISEINPDIIISSGGALLKYFNEYIFASEFSVSEIQSLIQKARQVCGENCEITIDTKTEHFWNYKINPDDFDKNWGGSTYSNFTNFNKQALKMCVEITDKNNEELIQKTFSDYDCVRFSDIDWYKITNKNATKEKAIEALSKHTNISTKNFYAFGDDFADIGMLKLCGKGLAMGNAIEEVKKSVTQVIGSNDEEGIANYLTEEFEL